MLKKDSKNKQFLPCKIEEYYINTPTVNARKIVERLLFGVPPQHLEGFGAVVLYDTAGIKKNYGDEEKLSIARYIRAKSGECLPWIELLIDRIFSGFPTYVLRISFITDLILSDHLYHEIGHHIHMSQKTNDKESEAIAEKWSKKLKKRYFLRKYWYIVIPLALIFLPFERQIRKLYESKKSNNT